MTTDTSHSLSPSPLTDNLDALSDSVNSEYIASLKRLPAEEVRLICRQEGDAFKERYTEHHSKVSRGVKTADFATACAAQRERDHLANEFIQRCESCCAAFDPDQNGGEGALEDRETARRWGFTGKQAQQWQDRAFMKGPSSALDRLYELLDEAEVLLAQQEKQAKKAERALARLTQQAEACCWSKAEKRHALGRHAKIEEQGHTRIQGALQDLRTRAVMNFWRYVGDPCGDALTAAPLWENLEELLPEDKEEKARFHEAMRRIYRNVVPVVPKSTEEMEAIVKRLQSPYSRGNDKPKFLLMDEEANCVFKMSPTILAGLKAEGVSARPPMLRHGEGRALESSKSDDRKHWRHGNSPMSKSERLWKAPQITVRPQSALTLLRRTGGSNFLGPTCLGPPLKRNTLYRTYQPRPMSAAR